MRVAIFTNTSVSVSCLIRMLSKLTSVKVVAVPKLSSLVASAIAEPRHITAGTEIDKALSAVRTPGG